MPRKCKEQPPVPYCSVCGKKLSNNRYGKLCQSCYVYLKSGKEIHPLPPKGEIHIDGDGDLICHVCGKAYGKLGSHIALSHKITAQQYKKRFGIPSGFGLCRDELKDVLRDHVAENYEQCVTKNLVKHGENTRFKKGSGGRTKEMVSLFTRRQLRQHATKLSELHPLPNAIKS